MNIILRTTLGLLILVVTAPTVWLMYPLPMNGAPPAWAYFLSPLAVALGVLVALITLLSSRRRTGSQEYLDAALDLLSRSYSSLAQIDNQGPPKNDRMNWLGAARLVRASEDLSAKIIEASHKRIYAEQVEYWRGRFRDLILPSKDGFSEEYYAEDPSHMTVWSEPSRAPLAEKSLAVLFRFIRWPEGKEDPLAAVPAFSDKEIEMMEIFGPRRLGRLMTRVRKHNQEGNASGRRASLPGPKQESRNT